MLLHLVELLEHFAVAELDDSEEPVDGDDDDDVSVRYRVLCSLGRDLPSFARVHPEVQLGERPRERDRDIILVRVYTLCKHICQCRSDNFHHGKGSLLG